jgi:hypothetical protein
MVVHLPGGLALVDTGSPASFGTGKSLVLVGKTRQPKTSFSQVIETACRELGRDLDWLIGNDILGLCPVVLDWHGRKITFGGETGIADGCQIIPVDGRATVPVIKLKVANYRVKAFLDTGAWLSYASPEAVAGLRSVHRARDFHPVFGEFETEVYQLPIQVGGREINAGFGVLPCRQRGFVTATNGWILGSDFFRDRRVMLDYQNDRVIDCPPR